MKLLTLNERLNKKPIPKIEFLQRESFQRAISDNIDNLPNDKFMSVSVGDGIWDYLAFEAGAKNILATDIVDNPLAEESIDLLKSKGNWDFKKVEAEKKLPFEDNSFGFIYHQDVLEHVEKPYLFLTEQYRILDKGGYLLLGTPNLFRPANLIHLLMGKLKFPKNIGNFEEIGDYIHIQEFYKEQLDVLLKEVGFEIVDISYIYFGLSYSNLYFSKYPTSNVGKSLCHFLQFLVRK